MEQLSLVLEGKDVGLVGPEAAEQGSALREINPLLAGVGWELGARLPGSFLSSLADGTVPVAGRESWHLLDPFVAMPALHLQNGECLSLRSLQKGVPFRPRAKVLQPYDLSARGRYLGRASCSTQGPSCKINLMKPYLAETCCFGRWRDIQGVLEQRLGPAPL